MTTIQLNWSTIHPLQALSSNLDIGVAGIYIWGFNLNSYFLPYYVGKADNIEWRLVEHLGKILGGFYSIHDKSSLADFARFKGEETLFTPKGTGESMIEFIENRDKFRPHMDFMLEHFAFTYAALSFPKPRLSKILADAEKIVINEIGKPNLWNTRGGQISGKYTFENLGYWASINRT